MSNEEVGYLVIFIFYNLLKFTEVIRKGLSVVLCTNSPQTAAVGSRVTFSRAESLRALCSPASIHTVLPRVLVHRAVQSCINKRLFLLFALAEPHRKPDSDLTFNI